MNIKKYILLTTLFVGIFLTFPSDPAFLNRAQAQFNPLDVVSGIGGAVGGEKVHIVLDTSPTTNTMVINSTLSEQWAQLSSGLLDDLESKESVLDSLAWAMGKNVQQQLTAELVRWLGGQQEGQNGQVPFVQNYDEYYQNIIDDTAAEYLLSEAGDTAACDERTYERVRLGVWSGFKQQREKSQGVYGSNLSCEDETTNQHKTILGKLLGDITSCKDDVCFYFQTSEELNRRARIALEHEKKILDHSRGMIPSKVCQDVMQPDGTTRKICELVNPPFLAADATSFTLTEFPALQLLNIDEFDEVAGNFMSNLTNQVVQSGINALLQVGEDGNSYVDNLANEDVSQYQSGGATSITEAIADEGQYNNLLRNIIRIINDEEDSLDEDQESDKQCEDLELSDDLEEIKDDSLAKFNVSSEVLVGLNDLNARYNASTSTASTKSSIINAISRMKNEGLIHSEAENRAFRLTFVNQTFSKAICDFRYERAQCRGDGGSFDSNTECTLDFQ